MLRVGVVWRRSLFGLWLGLSLGCSSASDPAPAPAPGPDTGAVHSQVLTACTEFAARLCADSEPCCQRAYGAFDQQGCEDALRAEVCRPGADAVAAGFATYDEAAVEGCLTAHAMANAICVPTWQQNLEIRKSLWSACKVLRGKTEVGKGCTTDVTCSEPDGAQTAICVGGMCRVLSVLNEGDACPFQSGAVSTCDAGLFCTTTMDRPGVCTAELALGSACSGVLADPSCGFGNYCDSRDQTCKQTVNLGGPSCKQGLECVSFECDRTTEICAPAPAIVSADQCLGAAR